MSKRKKNILAHITGFPGSGKTTLAIEIAKRYDNIAVKDTDEFIIDLPVGITPHEMNTIMIRKLDYFLKKNETKNIVLVGFLTDLSITHHRFFLNTSLEISSKRVISRLLNEERNRENFILNLYRESEKGNINFAEFVDKMLNYRRIMAEHKGLKIMYVQEGYKIKTHSQVLEFLDSQLKRK